MDDNIHLSSKQEDCTLQRKRIFKKISCRMGLILIYQRELLRMVMATGYNFVVANEKRRPEVGHLKF